MKPFLSTEEIKRDVSGADTMTVVLQMFVRLPPSCKISYLYFQKKTTSYDLFIEFLNLLLIPKLINVFDVVQKNSYVPNHLHSVYLNSSTLQNQVLKKSFFF